jgi:hypothetical protein
MKIDDAQLSKAYREYVAAKLKGPSDSCPSVDEIVDCLRDKSRRKKQKKIIAHISECPECFEIAQSFLDVLKREEQFEKEVGMIVKGDAREYPQKKLIAWKRTPLKWVAAIAFGIVSLIVIYRLSLFKPIDDRERGGRTEGIQISQPSTKRIDRNDLIIRWEKFDEIDQYVVEIYDKAFKSIWRSDIINSIDVKLPMRIVQGLEPNESYFIMVSAIIKDGKEISSKMKEFIIEK